MAEQFASRYPPMERRQAMKVVGIEEFAAWAVQEEWPKAGSGDVEDYATVAAIQSAIGRLGAPGTGLGFGAMNWHFMVSEGSVRVAPPRGVPHPDAVLFSHACNELAEVASSPPYDVADCLSDQVARLAAGPGERLDVDWRGGSAHLQGGLPRPRELVLAYAAMARRPTRGALGWTIARPDWHPDEIERDYVRAESGGHPRWFATIRRRVRVSGPGEPVAYEVREFEEEGYDPQLKRPKAGAYRKVMFDPDPGFIARERHIHAVWWCSLEWLAAWLEASGRLSAHRLLGPQGVEKPWQSASQKVA